MSNDEVPRNFVQEREGGSFFDFRRDAVPFLTSVSVHAVIVLIMALVPVIVQERSQEVAIELPPSEPYEELSVAQEFAISATPTPEIGANSEGGTAMALSVAEIVGGFSEVASPANLPVSPIGEIAINNDIQRATGLHFDHVAVRGSAGEGVKGAAGAVDRITKEILLSLEERRTLVVWFFDQSGSLSRQRREIHDRFQRIYDELGVIEATGNPAFKKYEDKPLLTSIVAFGSAVKFMTEKPTDDLSEIQSAISAIDQDESGVELVFTALHSAAERYRRFRRDDPVRNILFVVFSDEVGDDQNGLDKTLTLCRRLEIPVYVVGIPAPFGKVATSVKWIDPDPNFDQTPQWPVVNQGPETLLPEVVSLPFIGGEDPDPIDSGFGPYSLTRLCYETGGVYFTVHPNRNVNREVRRGEVSDYSAHLKHFFDAEVMRKYRPDYVSREEYQRRLAKSKARTSLVRAAEVSGGAQLDRPNRRFVKLDDASFANALTEAQKAAAVIEPKLNQLYEVLRVGEPDRAKETEPRWQAGYDLAMGRVLAAKIRAEGYNAMLAAAKRGLAFKDPKNNTWILESTNDVSTGSQMAKASEQSRMYLERVVKEHPDTPWALLAQLELKTPLGWRWKEGNTNIPPRVANKKPAGKKGPPAVIGPKMLPKPAPKRSPPKL